MTKTKDDKRQAQAPAATEKDDKPSADVASTSTVGERTALPAGMNVTTY